MLILQLHEDVAQRFRYADWAIALPFGQHFKPIQLLQYFGLCY